MINFIKNLFTKKTIAAEPPRKTVSYGAISVTPHEKAYNVYIVRVDVCRTEHNTTILTSDDLGQLVENEGGVHYCGLDGREFSVMGVVTPANAGLRQQLLTLVTQSQERMTQIAQLTGVEDPVRIYLERYDYRTLHFTSPPGYDVKVSRVCGENSIHVGTMTRVSKNLVTSWRYDPVLGDTVLTAPSMSALIKKVRRAWGEKEEEDPSKVTFSDLWGDKFYTQYAVVLGNYILGIVRRIVRVDENDQSTKRPMWQYVSVDGQQDFVRFDLDDLEDLIRGWYLKNPHHPAGLKCELGFVDEQIRNSYRVYRDNIHVGWYRLQFTEVDEVKMLSWRFVPLNAERETLEAPDFPGVIQLASRIYAAPGYKHDEPNNIYVLYHRNCMDGSGAQAAAFLKFGNNATYLPVQYNEPVPAILPHSDVYILDFSFKRPELTELRNTMRKIVVLDHHETSMKDLEGLDYAIFDMNRSGAMLAWNYFHPELEAPEIIKLVQDRDLWRMDLKGTLEFNAGFQEYKTSMSAWMEAMADSDEGRYFMSAVKANGGHVVRYQNALVAQAVKTAQVVMIDNHRVGVTNATNLISEIGQGIYNSETLEVDYSVTYFIKDADTAVLSFRSRKSGPHMGDIAKGKFGGGGHPNAAGAAVPMETLQKLLRGELGNQSVN